MGCLFGIYTVYFLGYSVRNNAEFGMFTGVATIFLQLHGDLLINNCAFAAAARV
jgi:hypothetical protein